MSAHKIYIFSFSIQTDIIHLSTHTHTVIHCVALHSFQHQIAKFEQKKTFVHRTKILWKERTPRMTTLSKCFWECIQFRQSSIPYHVRTISLIYMSIWPDCRVITLHTMCLHVKYSNSSDLRIFLRLPVRTYDERQWLLCLRENRCVFYMHTEWIFCIFYLLFAECMWKSLIKFI